VSCRQQEQFYAHQQQKYSDDFSEVLPPDYLNDTADNYST
jgi:hypothetical protein